MSSGATARPGRRTGRAKATTADQDATPRSVVRRGRGDKTPLADASQPEEAIGRRIRAFRLELGLRQVDLAQGKLTKAFISQVESGHSRPSPESLEHIAGRLGVPLLLLLGKASLADRSTYLLKAVRAAVDARDTGSAEALLPEAEKAIRDQHLRGVLHRLRAEVEVLQGRHDSARKTVLRALEELDTERDTEEAALAVKLAGRVHAEQGQFAAALQYLDHAANIAERAPVSAGTRSAIFANRGTMHMHLGHLDNAMLDYERASDAAAEAEDLFQIGVAEMGLGEAARDLGDYTRAIGHVERAIMLVERLHLQRLRAQLLHNLGHVHADRGDGVQARGYQERALAAARAMRDPGLAGNALERLAALDLAEGRALEGLARALEATAAAHEAADLGLIALAHTATGEAYAALERTELEDQAFAEARSAAEVAPAREQRQVWLRLGTVYRQSGRADEASDCFERAARIAG